MKNAGYLEKLFETWLAAITDIRIYNTKTLAEFFGKPSLFNPFFFKDLFYPIHVLCHTNRMIFSIKI